MGGYEQVKNSFRYFLFPGKAHDDGGRGTNTVWSDEEGHELIDALRRWREDGQAPEYLIAAHIDHKEDMPVTCVGQDADLTVALSKVKFMRKIYPYQGDLQEGEDFPVCCDERYLNGKE